MKELLTPVFIVITVLLVTLLIMLQFIAFINEKTYEECGKIAKLDKSTSFEVLNGSCYYIKDEQLKEVKL